MFVLAVVFFSKFSFVSPIYTFLPHRMCIRFSRTLFHFSIVFQSIYKFALFCRVFCVDQISSSKTSVFILFSSHFFKKTIFFQLDYSLVIFKTFRICSCAFFLFLYMGVPFCPLCPLSSSVLFYLCPSFSFCRSQASLSQYKNTPDITFFRSILLWFISCSMLIQIYCHSLAFFSK